MNPCTRLEFEAALDRLLRAAHRNGVDVGTGVDLRHPEPDVPDWDLEITPVRKRIDR